MPGHGQAIADLRMGERLARMTDALCKDVVDILGDGPTGELVETSPYS